MKKNFCKRLLAVLSTVCLIFGIAACGGDKEPAGENVWEDLYEEAQHMGYDKSFDDFVSALLGDHAAEGENGKDGEDGTDGKDGENGQDGKDGKDGADGKSAYDIWKENGYNGSEADFLEWIKGAVGPQGPMGPKGEDGTDGQDGKDGENGVGIQSVEVDENGHLKVTLTDGTVLDAGMVPTYEPEPDPDAGTEGLVFHQHEDEDGNAYAVLTDVGTAWETEIVIPAFYRGVPVKGIAKSAFAAGAIGTGREWLMYLKSVSIPESVTSIESDAFLNCYALESVTIEEGSSLCEIGENAFSGCISLESITIPKGVTEIKDNTFYFCSSLTEVSFAEGGKLSSIGKSAFSGCRSLDFIAIPEGVTSIGDSAFSGCDLLKSIVLPQSIQSIGYCILGEPAPLEKVYYAGAWAQWNAINFGTMNNILRDAVCCFSLVMPTDAQWAECNSWWHYDEDTGEIVEWLRV